MTKLRYPLVAFRLLTPNRVMRYGGALTAVVAAMGLRFWLEGWFGPGLPPYITFYPMVMAVAVLAGFGPGAVATVVASATVDYWILPPIGHFSMSSPIDQVALAIFVAMGLFMSGIAELYRRNRSKAANYEREALLRSSQDELRQSEERFRVMANAIPQLAWMARPDGHVFWYNARWYEYTGTTPEQMEGWGWQSTLDTLELPKVLDRWKDSIATGKAFDMSFRLRGIDGGFRQFLTRVLPINDTAGRVAQWFGTNTDVEEITRVENSLRKSEALYRGIGESIDYGVWICDADGRNTYASESFLKMVGLTQQQCSDFGWGDVLHPDDAAATVAAWRECVRTGGKWDREHRFRGADGEWHHVLARGVPIKDELGTIICWAGINLDISNLKKTEESLRISVEVANSANIAKSRFLAAASHDLRQPMSALSLYIAVLANKVAPADLEIVTSMKECMAGLSSLLNDLLDLSKLSAGVVNANVDDFSIAEQLDRLQSMHRPVAESKRLRLNCVPTKFIVRTDRVLLQRILSNFIDNAIRYTERGGVVVGCRHRQGKVFVEVWDSGIGIPADKTAEIFNEFTQLGDQARNRGSGLGLAIAAKAAALLGLEIQVRSMLGRGSVFAIEIPPGQAKMHQALPIGGKSYRSLRIALVEDHRFVREAIEMALQDAGHLLVSAASSDELLSALGASPPDAVISDYRLAGGLTGFEVISALRVKFGDNLPAILITGDTDPVLLRDMTEHGIVLLHKPLDLEDLQAHLLDMTNPAMTTSS